MITLSLLIVPLLGIFIISTNIIGNNSSLTKYVGLSTSVVNLIISLIIFILFDFSNNQFQFVQEYYELNGYNIYLGIDGLSIYFVLLTTIIMPIALLSNWTSINDNIKWYVIIILLLETLLLAVFLVLDIFLFYISFESTLPPLFLLIGIFGSSNRVRASFYLFLYTLLGSLFLLLSILTIYSIMGTTDFYALFRTNFDYTTQLFLFYGIFIAFAVKTPTIFLNNWLLKAHVESPLGGSVILAAIVLKLSLYGIFRLILPILPKASINYTFIVYLIGIITIIYASFSTLRTIDVKELIAYSSVSHAAVYLLGVFSNTIQGIEGGIILGLAHGFVSSGLFICTGGVLYDRSSTRLITYYRGITQIMPLFAILFFILCLSNAGTPLSLNFIGEFLSLYGTFERLPILGVLASTSIILSAAYTIYMFNRIAFGGKLSKFFKVNIPDLNKREFYILFTLVVFTVVLGIYPAPILDGLHYSASTLIYSISNTGISNDAPYAWGLFFQDSASPQMEAIVELHNSVMFYLFILSIAVIWVMFYITLNKKSFLNPFFINISFIKLILVVAPAIILIFITFPSFKLLYIMDEVMDPNLKISLNEFRSKLYSEYHNFINIEEEFLEFDSYRIPELDLKELTQALAVGDDSSNGEGSSNDPTNAEDSSKNYKPDSEDVSKTGGEYCGDVTGGDAPNTGDENNGTNPTNTEDVQVSIEGLEQVEKFNTKFQECDHWTRFRDKLTWSDDQEKNPIYCDNCGNVAMHRSGDEAVLCSNCHCVICLDCDDYNNDSDGDSAMGEDDEDV